MLWAEAEGLNLLRCKLKLTRWQQVRPTIILLNVVKDEVIARLDCGTPKGSVVRLRGDFK